MADLQAKRTRCMVYSRVMGFIRPVQYFNIGKKSEFYGRTFFKHSMHNSKKIDNNCCHHAVAHGSLTNKIKKVEHAQVVSE